MFPHYLMEASSNLYVLTTKVSSITRLQAGDAKARADRYSVLDPRDPVGRHWMQTDCSVWFDRDSSGSGEEDKTESGTANRDHVFHCSRTM